MAMRPDPIAWRGLGDSPSFGQQLGTGLTSGTLLGVSTGISTGSAIAGGAAAALAAIAPFTGPAAPFLAAAAALIGPIAKLFHGCGQTCVQATQYADQAGAALEQLLHQYFTQPVRYRSSQVAALAYIDQVFGYVQTSCGNPALGQAGQNCISQRLNPSACHWTASAPAFTKNADGSYSFTPAGRAGSGSWCFNWVTGYRDPVATDPGVVEDPPSQVVGSALSSVASALGLNTAGVPDWALPVGLLLLAALL